MNEQQSRRHWLKTTAALAAGIGLSPRLFAETKKSYTPGDTIWLNSNENAYGPSAATQKAMMEALSISNRYPDEILPKLNRQIAEFYQVENENVLLGAGGSEILALGSLLAASKKGKVIAPDPTFHGWYSQAVSFGLQFTRIPLANDRRMDLQVMMSAINDETRLMYVCNPNNPTGTFSDDTQLRNFVTECSKKTLVLVDEAYTEFANLSSLKDLAVSNPNIIIMKTFSKIYGLAGARVGYAIAHPDTIKKLAGYQTWQGVNVSVVSAIAASAALKDQAFVNDCRQKTKLAREMCYSTFKELKLDYIPSHTSFILFNIDRIGPAYPQKMQAKNIYVQYRDHFGGKWCRVSMGTLEEMNSFCVALKEIA
ncbi:MAG TPA: histidinol-phosphate transaminase [Chitinophagaceae bacterium]|nr:histidinol-phosphate transaminase [Chitinophagaceae bacterium]